jgi:LacI family transcriptional regulator
VRVTLRNIADEAGVSLQTVSNVVNGNSARVSPATAERVLEIVRRRGYVPSASARTLAGRTSRTIGLIVPARDAERLLLSPYDVDMLAGLERELRSRGYDLLLRGIDDLSELREVVQAFTLAGAVLLEFSEALVDEVTAVGSAPLVALDAYATNPAVRSVRIDDADGARQAARCLIDAGHTRIAFIGEIGGTHGVVRERLAGFTAELATAGLAVAPGDLIESTSTHHAGYALATELARAWRAAPDAGHPTAIFAPADILAIGLIQGFADAGVAIPTDVSIIGFDNLAAGTYVTPRLTTVAQDFAAKARAVCDLLFGDGVESPIITTVRLIDRESVATISHEAAAPRSPAAPH